MSQVVQQTRPGSIIPRTSLGIDAALVTGGAALTAIAAQVSVPWEPVPFTLQTMVVALCGLSLGARRGAAAMLAYLMVGAAGAPVFAGFKAGPQVLFGPTGGYLLAFVLGAWLLGAAADQGWDRSVLKISAVMAAALVAILMIGTTWLSLSVGGWQEAFALGTAPFLIGEALKAGVVILTLPAAWKLVKTLDGRNR